MRMRTILPVNLWPLTRECIFMDAADADAHTDRSDAISEPVESETTEQQPGPSGPSILETLKAPRLQFHSKTQSCLQPADWTTGSPW